MSKNYKKNVGRRPKKDGPNDLEQQVLQSVRLRNLPTVSQIRYEAEKLKYTLEKTYLPDFLIEFTDGRKLYIECKGWFRPEDRTKMAAVKRANPTLDIRFVFPRNNKLNKNTETTYTEWCAKHGFPSCVGTSIPKGWLQ